jgi:alpha-L-arabinofuranosidase
MTGLDRNSAVVHMASYAPLLAHVDAWQWRPDLIWFDNLNVTGTPNYYVQKLFSTHSGTKEIPAYTAGKPLTGSDSLYASSSLSEREGELYIKIVNTSGSSKEIRLQPQGYSFLKSGTIETLESSKLTDFNSMDDPKLIYPKEKVIAFNGRKIDLTIDPWSVNVVVLKIRK